MRRLTHRRFKASETLLGIETLRVFQYLLLDDRLRFKASETLLGIETDGKCALTGWAIGFKASETLLGIETAIPVITSPTGSTGFKASETLLGIETRLDTQEMQLAALWIQSL